MTCASSERAYYLLPLAQEQTMPAYTEAWRGLWRLVNIFQDLRGFHVEFEGLDTLSTTHAR